MSVLKVNTLFSSEFVGEMITSKATAPIGSGENLLSPYDMLLGALASCLYATFLHIAIKKRIRYENIDIEVTGEKRTTIPTTLEWVKVRMIIKNAEKEKGLIQAADLAAQYCSIYQTLSHVAEMSMEVEFV